MRRQRAVYAYLNERRLDAAVLADFEGGRDSSVRYLCGHPEGALLVLFARGESLLLPWDVAMAERLASVDRVRPYTDFKRSSREAIVTVLAQRRPRRVELSGSFRYPLVREVMAGLHGAEVVCRKDGIDLALLRQRAIKDQGETELLLQACAITDRLLAEVREFLEAGQAPAELALAAMIEGRARAMGAEGMGFETLAAGPARSFAIHCFPPVTGGPFLGGGLSILDFGVRYQGYTSDVTVTVLTGGLSELQERMVAAVEEAYRLAVSLIRPGASPAELARSIDELLAAHGFRMSHSLGHGIGLDVHEAPYLRATAEPDTGELAPGMVLTVEPGLNDPDSGGVRLENDVLVTASGARVLTSAAILRLP